MPEDDDRQAKSDWKEEEEIRIKKKINYIIEIDC